MENTMALPQKELKVELCYGPEILLLGIYTKELKAGSQRVIFISMLRIVLFTIAMRWKQPKCSTNEQTKHGGYIQRNIQPFKKEGNSNKFYNTNEPWGYYEG